MRAEDFWELIQPGAPDPPTRLGTIPATYTSGRPTVLFDGETTASARTYPYCGRYTPAANDRVILIRAGNGWVIFDKIL